MIQICYFIVHKPFENKEQVYLEIINESFFALTLYTLPLFVLVHDDSSKQTIGYFVIIKLGMMFGINLIYVFKGVAIKLKEKIINCRNKKVPINPATKYEVEKL